MPWLSIRVLFWDPKNWQYVGNMNYDRAVPEACENPATEALVFLIVGLRGFWKHPIAYVLQDKCSAKVQAQLISDCISLLHARGDQCSWSCVWWCIHKSVNCYSPWMQPWYGWNDDLVSPPSSTWVSCICDIWCLSHDQTGEKSLWWFQNHSITEWWGAEADPKVLPWGFECCSGNAWLFLCKQTEKEAHHMAEAQDACQLSCVNTEQFSGWCHWLPAWWACSK